MQEITYKAKLVSQQIDSVGYITYVFENLEYEDLKYKYLMCVRFPNWNHKSLTSGSTGYVTLKYVEGGVDKWYNGIDFTYYNYSNIIFSKFIEEIEYTDNIILVD